MALLDSAWRAARDPRHWRRHLSWSLGFFALFLPYFAWRFVYYGYLLPNTFYAKVPATSGYFAKGLPYVATFFRAYGVYVLLPFALLPALTRDRVSRRHFVVLLAAAASYLLYVAWVGGDFMEFRFMMPALPFLYYLAQEGLGRVHTMLAQRTGSLRLAHAVVALAVIAAAGRTFVPTVVYEHDRRFGWDIDKLVTSTRIQALTGEWLRRYAAPGESAAVSGGGVGPYRSRLYTVELHGLTDANIAHAKLDRRGRGMVGHERFASREYLEQKKITYVLAAPGLKTFTTEPLALEDVVSVRRDERVWLNFKTFEPIDDLRLRLLRRGASVLLLGRRTPLFASEDGTYTDWQRTGNAFGGTPMRRAGPERAKSAGERGGTERPLIDSGGGGRAARGTLVSPEFPVLGKQIQMRVGGGNDPDRLIVSLLVDGRRVLSATGSGTTAMRTELWTVEPYEGRRARLAITDEATGRMGYIAVDDVALVSPEESELPVARHDGR
jgi:hypothetical protein